MLLRHDSLALIVRAALLCVVTCLAACASAPLPPPVTAKVPPSEADKPPAEKPKPAPPAALASPKKGEPTTVVVEIGAEGDRAAGTDLVSIARAERERRAKAPRPSIVITNESLVRRPGPVLKPTAGAAKPQASVPVEAKAQPQGTVDRESQEALWRARALDIRTRLKEAQDRTEKLRRLTASMRDRFYLAPPQLGRDDSLWQEWGRLQESLAEAQKESQETERELEMFLEEGVAAGAQPGWLAEGEDILLEKEKPSEPSSIQAIEPPVVPPPGDHE